MFLPFFLHFALLISGSVADELLDEMCQGPDRDLDLYIAFDIAMNPSTKTALMLSDAVSKLDAYYSPSLYGISASLGFSDNAFSTKCYTPSVTSGTVAQVKTALKKRPASVGKSTTWDHVMFAVAPWLAAHDWSESASSRRLLFLHSQTIYSPTYVSESDLALSETPLQANCPLSGSAKWAIHPPPQQFAEAMRAMRAGLIVWRDSKYTSTLGEFWPYITKSGISDYQYLFSEVETEVSDKLFDVFVVATCPAYLASTSTGAPEYPHNVMKECLDQIDRCSTSSVAMKAALEECLAGK